MGAHLLALGLASNRLVLTYRFGSTLNHTVNPRFPSSGFFVF